MKFDEIFDINELPESTNNEPLPAGEYPVVIERAEICETKAGTGKYLKLMYRVTGESFNNACVFGNLNIRNQNPKAESIGRQQLHGLMRAVGIAKMRDTDELIGRELKIKLVIKKDEEYGDRNEVKNWKPVGDSVPKVAVVKSTATAGKATPPWAKG
jgi:hypothetical protein